MRQSGEGWDNEEVPRSGLEERLQAGSQRHGVSVLRWVWGARRRRGQEKEEGILKVCVHGVREKQVAVASHQDGVGMVALVPEVLLER